MQQARIAGNRSDENNPAVIDHSTWQELLDRYLINNHSSGINRVRYKDFTIADKQALETFDGSIDHAYDWSLNNTR